MNRTPLLRAAAAGTLFLICSLIAAIPAAAVPKVVVSILPIHSLVAGVMEGVGTPKLLIDRPVSPHTYSLRPSDAEAIAEADVIVWVGPTLESFLIKPLSTVPKSTQVITLTAEPSVHVIHVSGVKGLAKADPGSELDIDPHIWLDPDNAIAITRLVAKRLARIDPSNAAKYEKNAKAQIDDLIDLDMSTTEMTAGNFVGHPVILYHDSLRYFARRYGLEIAGTVLSGDKMPGARHMSDLRNIIAERNVKCVFTEPEFSPAMARALVEGTNAKVATIDPLGTKLTPGRQAYRFLIEGVFSNLLGCLRG